MTTSLSLIAYASGIAANNVACAEGPLQLQHHALEQQLSEQHLRSHWQAVLVSDNANKKDKLSRVVELNTELAAITFDLIQQNKRFAVLGGDHSCAIGTWSGVAAALAQQQNAELGLIWIDAHMDSHTFETTVTGNIHGMPLAALLGYGDTSLTHISIPRSKIDPKRLVLIGTRSFEAAEERLLQRLGVRIYNMEALEKRGLDTVLAEAIAYVKENSLGFGVSLDLDAIDPFDAPGVSVPEVGGISGENLCHVLKQLCHESSLLGVEVVEYNPYHDKNRKTERLIKEILLSIFGV
ncbi:MAG: arginase [Candidatus Aquirickettsiella sp.]